jgi:hypothetical protein
MAMLINLTHGALYFDTRDDLHELSRMANAAGEYARESGRLDLVEQFTEFGQMVRHAASESYRVPIGSGSFVSEQTLDAILEETA